jgi:3-oxoacyl-[acyl-carrier protein] reductase
MNQLDMEGRGAIVTGGAAGIGLAIARRLKKSGARLCLWDRDEAVLEAAARELGAHVERVDVTQEDAVAAAFRASLAALQRVDALVCSAGITGPNTTVEQYTLAAWKEVIDINLTGVFLCNRAAIAHMVGNKYGRIVNIASIAGKEGNPNASAYSASKAGVISLTKSLGKELAKTGVRVNCVTPAAVKTGMFAQMTQSHIDFMLSKIPMGRFGEVEEIAALVAWLSTEIVRFRPAPCSTCRAGARCTDAVRSRCAARCGGVTAAAAGLDEPLARDVADVLVEGDLLGHDTHGLALLAAYLAELEAGRMARQGSYRVIRERGPRRCGMAGGCRVRGSLCARSRRSRWRASSAPARSSYAAPPSRASQPI